MKLFFWRRRPQPSPDRLSPTGAAAPAGTATVIERSQIPTRPLAVPIELRDALLRFALECLVATGARVRVEADDLISAVLPDGTSVRYTSSLTRARAEDDAELLVQGGAALARLLDECAAHATVASLRLQAHADPGEVVRTQFATPEPGCGECSRNANAELCPRCPLRANRITVAGLPERAAPRLARQWRGRSIELNYILAANDRHGRRDELVRLAFDCATGTSLPPLTPAILADAQASPLPNDATELLKAVQTLAEPALAPQLHATGALLRLMAEREYRARLDDIRSTSQRLLRESPDDAAAIHAALERELERLHEVYAVEVDARLASVCFVERPMASLTITSRSGTLIELETDLASGALLPPTCAACGADFRAVFACADGHLLCPTCQKRPGSDVVPSCPICAGVSVPSSRAAVGASTRTLAGGEDPVGSTSLIEAPPATSGVADRTLTLAHLDAMSAATWRLFVSWLLEQDGYRIESGGTSGLLEYWMCQSASGVESLLTGALRHPDHRSLTAEDVERLVAQRAGKPAGSSLLISTALAASSAQDAARRLGVRLLDRSALSLRLNDLIVHHLHEREAALQNQQARAEVAATARAALLAALLKAQEILAPAENRRRAAGRSAVAAAAMTLTDALASASRALLAWDTLMSDWTSSFDEREARDGSLLIRADTAAFEEMVERARHLGAALAEPLGAIVATPGNGDLGYTVWRRDIVEQLSAQCEAYRWRTLAVDPSQRQSFTAARDLLAGERASTADATAAHAATRATRAYGELARRARLEASSA